MESCPWSCDVLCSEENAEAQEIEVGTAVHGTLDELKVMNLAFGRSVESRLRKFGQGVKWRFCSPAA